MDMLVSLEYRISRRALSYKVQSQRNKLPIARFRDKIVQTLETSQVLVLSGETGWSVLSENSDISMTGCSTVGNLRKCQRSY
jgi:hypothetical protein